MRQENRMDQEVQQCVNIIHEYINISNNERDDG